MKHSHYLLIVLSFFLIGFLPDKSDQFKVDPKTAARVKELLSKMTLEEKVGQMTQVTLEVVSKIEGTKDQMHELDLEKLREAMTKYHVGSIINVFNVAHSLEYWHSIITEIQNISANETRLGIPVIYGIDAIHGANYTKNATLFPQAINIASTWNIDFAEEIGAITSIETKASGIPWNFYPVMDIGRQPLWPRLWETFGEDVHLASEMGAAYIRGAQGENIGDLNKLATCLKHFVGYSYPLNGQDRTPAWISERMLREYFLPTFEAGIRAGSPTIMVNSGEVDGIPTHSDHYLLTEVLRDELKFEGFVVSDWEDIIRLYERDRVADSPKEAVRLSVMAGVDMSMVPMDFSFYNLLLELVNEGSVPVKRIDEAVSRILAVKFKLGLFDNTFINDKLKSEFATPESNQINLLSAIESIILTKNANNLLPLSKEKKIFVTGPTANMLSVMNGGWTITWQGDEELLYPQEELTVLEAIEKKIGKENVSYSQGTDFDNMKDVDKSLEEASKADVVILCLGEPAYCESPGNISDLTLDEAQINYAQKLASVGKPIILIMLQGRPRLINKIVPEMNSIIIAFLPGMKGGEAIADIIFGDANPSGKLPVTYPRFPNGNTTYDYKPIEEFDVNYYYPQWSFGFGLSYTKFEYSNLVLDKKTINSTGSVEISVDVKNTGSIVGKEAVQLYVCDLYGSISRPNKQLKGFEKISLLPGETKTVKFLVEADDLSFIGRGNKRIVEHGEFNVMIDLLEDTFVMTK
jgi:beta-glucosidase